MPATAYGPLTIERISRDGWISEDHHEGQVLAMLAVGFTDAQLSGLGEHPGVGAWEQLVDEAVAEIEPKVRDLLAEAIERPAGDG